MYKLSFRLGVWGDAGAFEVSPPSSKFDWSRLMSTNSTFSVWAHGGCAPGQRRLKDLKVRSGSLFLGPRRILEATEICLEQGAGILMGMTMPA